MKQKIILIITIIIFLLTGCKGKTTVQTNSNNKTASTETVAYTDVKVVDGVEIKVLDEVLTQTDNDIIPPETDAGLPEADYEISSEDMLRIKYFFCEHTSGLNLRWIDVKEVRGYLKPDGFGDEDGAYLISTIDSDDLTIFIVEDNHIVNIYDRETALLHRDEYDGDPTYLANNIYILTQYPPSVIRKCESASLLSDDDFWDLNDTDIAPKLIGKEFDIERVEIGSIKTREDGSIMYGCYTLDHKYDNIRFFIIHYPGKLDSINVSVGDQMRAYGVYAGWLSDGDRMEHFFVLNNDYAEKYFSATLDGEGVYSDEEVANVKRYIKSAGYYGYDDRIEPEPPPITISNQKTAIEVGDNVRYGGYPVFHGYVEDVNENQSKVRWISITGAFGYKEVRDPRHIDSAIALTGFKVGGSNWVDNDRLRVETSGW